MMRPLFTFILLVALLSAAAGAQEPRLPLDHVKIDLGDRVALQRGARYFTNYCLSCHELKYIRYRQLEPGLGLTDKEIEDNLMLPGAKIGDRMRVAMPRKAAKKWFGVAPPDLSDIARVRGIDWLYSYLRGFYRDPKRPFGVNNVVFKNVPMPDVLWKLQGWQDPVYANITGPDGSTHKVLNGVKLVKPGSMTPEEFNRTVKDIVTFLAYVSAPYQRQSHRIGAWVISAVILFTILAYILKRDYWKDVDHDDERQGRSGDAPLH